MKAEIKEKWIAALESGDYEKGTERLKTNNIAFTPIVELIREQL